MAHLGLYRGGSGLGFARLEDPARPEQNSLGGEVAPLGPTWNGAFCKLQGRS